MSSMGEPAAAFTAVYERHYAAVLRYAVRRVGEAHARDVVAETFLIVWRRRTHLPPDNPLPCLYRTAGNVISNERRRQASAAGTAQRLADRSALDAAGGGPAERLGSALDSLATLSDADQEVLRLHAWEGLDGSELAEALGCSRAAGSVRLHRARKRLSLAVDRQASAGSVPHNAGSTRKETP